MFIAGLSLAAPFSSVLRVLDVGVHGDLLYVSSVTSVRFLFDGVLTHFSQDFAQQLHFSPDEIIWFEIDGSYRVMHDLPSPSMSVRGRNFVLREGRSLGEVEEIS